MAQKPLKHRQQGLPGSEGLGTWSQRTSEMDARFEVLGPKLNLAALALQLRSADVAAVTASQHGTDFARF